MTEPGTPMAEVEIDAGLLADLLRDQMPELATQPVQLLDTGWDNVSFRVGRNLIVRMPRRAAAAPLIEHEQKWLPTLAERLPIPVPAPIAIGRPGHGYPWAWSVLPWLPGRTADLDWPVAEQADRFAEFLRALHRPAPDDAPVNPHRGVPLADRAEMTEARMARVRERTSLISPEVDHAWQAALSAPIATQSTWLHGDLHARNVLVDEGRFTGIIDWGDMSSGDAAVDLAAIWMLFEDRAARRRAIENYAAPDSTWQRALGWAVFFGAILVDSGSVDDPRLAAMGEATLRRLTEDA